MRTKMGAPDSLDLLGVAVLALAILFAVALPSTVMAQQGMRMSMRITQDQLLALQKKYQDACLASDAAALDSVLADDMVFVHGGAAMDTKASFIDSIKSGKLKIASYEASDPKIVFFHGGAIISAITDVGLASPKGGAPRVLRMRISSVWIPRPAGWQMILTQATPVQSNPTNR
jgi:ketosteroid isomerase-like protein